MITGKVHETAVLDTNDGRSIKVQAITPEVSTANLMILARERKRWEGLAAEYDRLAQAKQLPFQVAVRAHFGTDVLFMATQQMQSPKYYQQNETIIITDGTEVLGLGIMDWQGTKGHIHLAVIDPRYLAGAPGPKIRGIGTMITRTMGARFVALGVTEVELTPADQEAANFWSGRGFLCNFPEHCHLYGPQAVAALSTRCGHENPDTEFDVPIIGDYASTEPIRLPSQRGRY